MTFSIGGTTVITSDRIVQLTTGATASRPAAGSRVPGQLFFDTTLGKLIVWDGAVWRESFTLTEYPALLWSWGQGDTGLLGNGTAGGTLSPVSVIGGFNDWILVSAGLRGAGAIRANGSAWVWGWNNYGNLGNNTSTTLSVSSPVSVVGGFTDWKQISVGQYHSTGLRANGTIWSWGRAHNGRLGNHDGTNHRSSPVSLLGGLSDWKQVSAHSYHTLAVRTNGTAWAWGGNGGYDRLGNNIVTNASSPISVTGGFTDWSFVSAGHRHSAGLRANGVAMTWGNNAGGRLGDSTVIQRVSPVSVVGGFTDWTIINAGWQNTAGLRSNGTIWTWGTNAYGQLGINLSGVGTSRSSPVSVVGGFTDWSLISVGDIHMVGLRANGSLWSWGYNGFSTSRLGDGTTANRSSPVSVIGGITDWSFVSANYGTHAIRSVLNRGDRFTE